jgi:hypothetical protein
VFYSGAQGLELIVAEGDRWIPNLEAPTAKEVLDYLRREQQYGNKVTGRTIEQHFGGTGYGWELDVLRVVLAVLLRAGAVEVTHQGRRYRGHQDPQSRVPLTNTPAFRAASFAPRESAPTLRDLTRSVEQYEQLTGEEVDVEEAAIATALKKFAAAEVQILIPLEATARAQALDSLLVPIADYRATLDAIMQADTDDCVRILAGEGASLRETRDRLRQIGQVLEPSALRTLQLARTALRQLWPLLQAHEVDEATSMAADELRSLLEGEELYRNLPNIRSAGTSLVARFYDLYRGIHEERLTLAVEAIDAIKGDPAWLSVTDEDVQTNLLAPLTSRACVNFALPEGSLTCSGCNATLGQMESDIDAIPALQSIVAARLQTAVAPPDQRVERVRVAPFFVDSIEDDVLFNEAVERLRSHLRKLVDEGARIVLE